MKRFWTALVGSRHDPHLRHKWWHKLVLAGAFGSSLFLYVIVAAGYEFRPIEPTSQTTFSLSLLSFAQRPGITTLGDLQALPTTAVGVLTDEGKVTAFDLHTDPQDVTCTSPPKYRAHERVKVVDPDNPAAIREYQAIDDAANQPAKDLRHCAAIVAYKDFTADRIVAYRPDAFVRRQQAAEGSRRGFIVIPFWLVVYWNVYYRGLIPLYLWRRRKRVGRRPAMRHSRE